MKLETAKEEKTMRNKCVMAQRKRNDLYFIHLQKNTRIFLVKDTCQAIRKDVRYIQYNRNRE